MGTRPANAQSGLADALFTPVQQRVLGLLFGQPERRFQSAELIRLADSGTGAAHRQLARLETAGLATVIRIGNQKHYQANRESPVFEELRGLVVKTVGVLEPLQHALQPLASHILAAFVYGSVAAGTDKAGSDIDLMVISDSLHHDELFNAIAGVERRLGRPVNPSVMTRVQWRTKRGQRDSFAARLVRAPRLFVLGSDHDIS
jgi:predicted nucleotidyltransferase